MITTSRGAAIPLPLDHSFCMMARLYPKIRPYTVLATAGGFLKMHGATAWITGLVCFLLELPSLHIASITLVATLLGYSMSLFAIYPPGFLRVSRIYSLLTGYGVLFVGLSVFGVVRVGVLGTALFWISRLVAEFVTMAHSNHLGRKFLKITNPEAYALFKSAGIPGPDGFAIRCFGNAYATYACKLGAPLDFLASESELQDYKWKDVLREFVEEWPQITRRFQVTDEEWDTVMTESRV